MTAASKEYRDRNFRAVAYSSIFSPLIRVPITVSYETTMFLAGLWVLESNTTHNISLGDIALFHALQQRLLWPLSRIG